jgi:predicted regulator of Ras-like GTPase activity (Roadblock/LC7/MglB family)
MINFQIMDKIIQILNDDKTCQGYLIVSLDGTIIDSSGKLEQKASLAQSMCKIFCKLKLPLK